MIIENGQVVTNSEESDQDELVEEEIQENEKELEDGSHSDTFYKKTSMEMNQRYRRSKGSNSS